VLTKRPDALAGGGGDAAAARPGEGLLRMLLPASRTDRDVLLAVVLVRGRLCLHACAQRFLGVVGARQRQLGDYSQAVVGLQNLR